MPAVSDYDYCGHRFHSADWESTGGNQPVVWLLPIPLAYCGSGRQLNRESAFFLSPSAPENLFGLARRVRPSGRAPRQPAYSRVIP